MSDSRDDCALPARFPRQIFNRPGMPRIGYRIGTYADFFAALLSGLNRDPVLEAWSHREGDDPGIALLEGAAVLGDILTFYQELYANEAYLRTARWRESIADLVRLTGYRLAPGIGGRGLFAMEVRGAAPVTVPAGFAMRAQLAESERRAEFETLQELAAYPSLSKFHLYRSRRPPGNIAEGLNRLELAAVDAESDAAALASVDFAPGDRIMLVPDSTMFDVTSTKYATQGQGQAQVLVVSKVTRELDRVVLQFQGALAASYESQVRAYRIGRSFRHFGYNAPAQLSTYDNASHSVMVSATDFTRQISTTHEPSDGLYYPSLDVTDMPLDQQVNDLAAGGHLICQGCVEFDSISDDVLFGVVKHSRSFAVVKQIQSVEANSLAWGNLSAGTSVVCVNNKLMANENILFAHSDIRRLSFHEVTSPELTLAAPAAWDDGSFSTPVLNFYGTYAEAQALAGRQLLLLGPAGQVQARTVTSGGGDFALAGRDQAQRWLWPLALESVPEGYLQQDFDEVNPTVTVYGNVVVATQGKTQEEAVLGNGDSRQDFQTFKLPDGPLTYHLAAGAAPPQAPELQIYVDRRLWRRAPVFFGHGPDEEIYIVREDAEGSSYVQFGDGETGRRLPSGLGNVVARFRIGSGAFGPLTPETTVQPTDRLERLNRVELPGIITGGEEPESGANARRAAPGKLQSLDRLVSLQDFESETLAVPGVSRVRAAWGLVDGVPGITLTVLMKTGRAAEIANVRDILAEYNRCRGPRRHVIHVIQGHLLYVTLAASVAYDPALRREDVWASIKQALGAPDADVPAGAPENPGLFALDARQFGQPEYATRIAAAIQNVPGVAWTRLTALAALGEADDPATLPLPAAPSPAPSLSPDSWHILALFGGHLNLAAVSEPAAEAC